MSSPPQESKTPQNWAVRAAELKEELMARRGLMVARSESSNSKMNSQNSLGSMSSSSPSSNVLPRLASTSTPPPTSQDMTSGPNHEEAQKIQNQLKELGRIIAFGASKTQVPKIDKTVKMPHVGSFAANHAASLPSKPTTDVADCEEVKAREGETSTTKEIHPMTQVSTNINTENATVSTPGHDIKGTKSRQVQPNDGTKDTADDDEINKVQLEKQRKSSRIREDTTPEDGEIQSNDSQASSQSKVKGVLLPSAPISRSAASKALPSTSPHEPTSQNPTKMTLPLLEASLPEKPASEPAPQDETPLMASHSHKRRGWELQHYRPSLHQARRDRANDFRGQTRRPLRLSPLAPSHPDSPKYKQSRHPNFEHDKPTSQDRDLDDWLSFTGWHDRDFRADFLQRKRRLAYLDREKNEIEQERAKLMSADEHALVGSETVGYRSRGSVHNGADEFVADFPSRNAGRELFNSPEPAIRRKREYTSDGENRPSRKMSRLDTGDRHRRRRDSSNYRPRGHVLDARRSTPDHLAGEYG